MRLRKQRSGVGVAPPAACYEPDDSSSIFMNSKANDSSNRSKDPASGSDDDESRDAELASFLMEVMRQSDNPVVVAAIQRQMEAARVEKESRNDDDNLG